jgi:DNA polymerase-3 subunit alpha
MADNGAGFQQRMEALPDMKEWPQAQILSYEKELLGFYLSGHPLAHYQVEAKKFTDYTVKDLPRATDGQMVTMVGLIQTVKLTTTRRTSERMAILKVDDMEGQVEVVVFPSTYPNVAKYLQEGAVVLLKGRVSFRDEAPKIIASDMNYIEEAYKDIKSISIDLSGINEKGLKNLKERLSAYPGQTPVYLRLDTENYKSVQILVGEDLFVTPNEELMDKLKEIVGSDRFSLAL